MTVQDVAELAKGLELYAASVLAKLEQKPPEEKARWLAERLAELVNSTLQGFKRELEAEAARRMRQKGGGHHDA